MKLNLCNYKPFVKHYFNQKLFIQYIYWKKINYKERKRKILSPTFDLFVLSSLILELFLLLLEDF